MKHNSETNPEFSNLMSKNQTFDSYFSNYFMSKNNLSTIDEKCNKVQFVVEWQLEDDKKVK